MFFGIHYGGRRGRGGMRGPGEWDPRPVGTTVRGEVGAPASNYDIDLQGVILNLDRDQLSDSVILVCK